MHRSSTLTGIVCHRHELAVSGAPMATTGFLGVAASRGDPMSQMDAEDLIEFLLKSNQEMVAAAREWEDSAAQERQKLEVEIAGLRGRCAEYETIIEENERGLRQQLAKSSRNVQDLTEALREEASIGCEENEQLRVETEQLRVEIVQLQRERDAALLRAKKAEKASKTKAKEATDLRKELLIVSQRLVHIQRAIETLCNHTPSMTSLSESASRMQKGGRTSGAWSVVKLLLCQISEFVDEHRCKYKRTVIACDNPRKWVLTPMDAPAVCVDGEVDYCEHVDPPPTLSPIAC